MPGERGGAGIPGPKGDRVSHDKNVLVIQYSYVKHVSFSLLDVKFCLVTFFYNRVTLGRKDLKVLPAKMVPE